MVEYTQIITEIQNAASTEEIQQLVNSYSASATGRGGILYTGNVGNVPAHDIATEIFNFEEASGTTVNIIDNTPRGLLLSDDSVKQAILSSVQNIVATEEISAGADISQANTAGVAAAEEFLYGKSVLSLWGQASFDFASSLSGDITM